MISCARRTGAFGRAGCQMAGQAEVHQAPSDDGPRYRAARGKDAAARASRLLSASICCVARCSAFSLANSRRPRRSVTVSRPALKANTCQAASDSSAPKSAGVMAPRAAILNGHYPGVESHRQRYLYREPRNSGTSWPSTTESEPKR